jgi:hypothetical protein
VKVLCCGGREWQYKGIIRRVLTTVRPTSIVEGECRGADVICRQVAETLGIPVHKHPADWKKHGKAAGHIRNQEMLDKHPDIELVLAFHNDIANSKGTGDMKRRAEKAGIPVRVIKST